LGVLPVDRPTVAGDHDTVPQMALRDDQGDVHRQVIGLESRLAKLEVTPLRVWSLPWHRLDDPLEDERFVAAVPAAGAGCQKTAAEPLTRHHVLIRRNASRIIIRPGDAVVLLGMPTVHRPVEGD